MNQCRRDYSCFIAFTGFESDTLMVSQAVVINAISTKTTTFEPDISNIKTIDICHKADTATNTIAIILLILPVKRMQLKQHEKILLPLWLFLLAYWGP